MINSLRMFRTGIAILLTASCFYACTTPAEKEKEITSTVNAPAKAYTIVIQEMKFTPATIDVSVGDTVTWINKDIVDHNVTEEINNEWTSGTLSPGSSWNMVVTKNVSYFCTIHPVMKGSLNVR